MADLSRQGDRGGLMNTLGEFVTLVLVIWFLIWAVMLVIA